MLHKINIGVGIIALLLLILKIVGYGFEPFPNFIFAFLSLLFLLQGIEQFQAKRKWEGSLFSLLGLLFFLVVVTSF